MARSLTVSAFWKKAAFLFFFLAVFGARLVMSAPAAHADKTGNFFCYCKTTDTNQCIPSTTTDPAKAGCEQTCTEQKWSFVVFKDEKTPLSQIPGCGGWCYCKNSDGDCGKAKSDDTATCKSQCTQAGYKFAAFETDDLPISQVTECAKSASSIDKPTPEELTDLGLLLKNVNSANNVTEDQQSTCRSAIEDRKAGKIAKEKVTESCTPFQEAKKAIEAAPAEAKSAVEGLCAGTSGEILCFPLTVFNWILDAILHLLSIILLFVIDIFMGFARYNSFGTAPPVQNGWPLVRDLVNMFFIAVILVSAFATIIGYGQGEFHVKKVLPRLLLMAVLINFSKTLILLVVDFSQVVMLTFVNAFQQVASSGLASAFGIQKYTAMAEATGAATDRINIMISYMLAIIVAGSAVAIMLILTLWVLGRIVGLWVAIILAPLALFLTALPNRIGGKMGKIGGEYWSQLAGLLTGGPIVAFFLWLTFAMLASMSGGQLAQSMNLYTPSDVLDKAGFMTKLGQSGQIAALLVAMVMLTKALEIATASAKQIGGVVGEWAGKISTTAPGYAKWAATLPFGMARMGGRAVGRGARGAVARVGGAGKLAAFVQARPTLGRVFGGVTRRMAVEEAAGVRKRAAEVMTASQFAELPPALKVGALQDQERKVKRMGRLASPADKAALADMHTQFSSDPVSKQRTKTLSGDIEKSLVAGGMPADQAKRAAGMQAAEKVKKENATHLAEARNLHASMGNMDQVEAIENQIAKNPTLAVDQAGVEAVVAKNAHDPEALGKMDRAAKESGSVALAIGKQHNLFKADGKGGVSADRSKWEDVKKAVKDETIIATMEKMMNHAENSTRGGKTGVADESKLASMSVVRDKDGARRTYDNTTGQRARSDNEEAAHKYLSASPAQANNPVEVEKFMRAGGDVREAEQLGTTGATFGQVISTGLAAVTSAPTQDGKTSALSGLQPLLANLGNLNTENRQQALQEAISKGLNDVIMDQAGGSKGTKPNQKMLINIAVTLNNEHESISAMPAASRTTAQASIMASAEQLSERVRKMPDVNKVLKAATQVTTSTA